MQAELAGRSCAAVGLVPCAHLSNQSGHVELPDRLLHPRSCVLHMFTHQQELACPLASLSAGSLLHAGHLVA